MGGAAKNKTGEKVTYRVSGLLVPNSHWLTQGGWFTPGGREIVPNGDSSGTPDRCQHSGLSSVLGPERVHSYVEQKP